MALQTSTFQLFLVITLITMSVALLRKEKRRSAGSIIYFFLFWTFVQYFLSLSIAYFSGGWQTRLLIPASGGRAFFVSIAFGAFVVLGYLLCRALEPRVDGLTHNSRKRFELSRKSTSWFMIAGALVGTVGCLMASEIIEYGSVEGLFYDYKPRGAAQWEKVTFSKWLATTLYSIATGIGAMGAILIAARFGQSSKYELPRLILVAVAVCIFSFPLFEKFSRGSGLLFVAAFFVLLLRFRRYGAATKAISFVLPLVGLYLCLIGISHRNGPQGVGSFLSTAFAPSSEKLGYAVGVSRNGAVNFPSLNFFDSFAPLSAHIHFSNPDNRTVLDSFQGLFFALQPFPHSWFGRDVLFGASLTEAFGTYGSTGITSPAVAELFFLFGWGFVLFAFLFGNFLRRIDVLIAEKGTALSYIVFALGLGAIIISGHVGIRGFARPAMAAFLLLVLEPTLSKMLTPKSRPGFLVRQSPIRS